MARGRVKRLLIWYLPQAGLFCLAVWFWFQVVDPPPFPAAMLVGVMLAAAYTGAANLIISLVARLQRHRGKTGRDSLRLTSPGRRLSEAAEHRKRIGIGE